MEKKYIRSNEPIVWGLFGAGGMVAAFLLPALILITGLLVPLGIVDEQVLSYQRVLAFSEHWLGKILLLITISLSVWHGIHRFYHGLHDLGQHNHRRVTFFICYGFALCITLLTAFLLL
jgi:fumarate reductase subunit D